MENKLPVIKLYGAERCHKTRFYKELLKAKNQPFQFLDVEENKAYAEELKGLYESGRLNFPTITIGSKKLRNPKEVVLDKWINNLITNVFNKNKPIE